MPATKKREHSWTHQFQPIETLQKWRGPELSLSTKRGLSTQDLYAFKDLCIKHPGCRVRVYGERGFVPNAYDHRCEIQYIERGYDLADPKHPVETLEIEWTGAQRANASGSLRVVVPVRDVQTLMSEDELRGF